MGLRPPRQLINGKFEKLATALWGASVLQPHHGEEMEVEDSLGRSVILPSDRS